MNATKSKVLVLDDDALVARGLSLVLSKSGFSVATANTQDAATRILKTQAIAVIICDQNMPDGPGVEFLVRCASEFPTVVRILLTGVADAQVAAHAINRAQVFRVLWKPSTVDEMTTAVRQGVWTHRLWSEAIDEGNDSADLLNLPEARDS